MQSYSGHADVGEA